jgi:hypothetical protein
MYSICCVYLLSEKHMFIMHDITVMQDSFFSADGGSVTGHKPVAKESGDCIGYQRLYCTFLLHTNTL